MPPPDRASFFREFRLGYHDGKFHSERVFGVGESEIRFLPDPFCAVHASPCGKHFVAVSPSGHVLLVPNFEQAIRAEGDQANLKGAGYVLMLNMGITYMAFDGKRIVLATVWHDLRYSPLAVLMPALW